MLNHNHLSSYGYILKKEKLTTFETEHHFAELILEDLDPFPGFYDHFFLPASEKDIKPRALFLILKEFDVCHEDQFIRMTMHIKHEHNIKFDAALGNVQLFNQPAPCIRLNMNDYNVLPQLVSHYKSLGLKFQSTKKISAFQSLIRLRKFFHIEVIEPGIYKDLEQADTFYLRMPGFITWDDFETATNIVRSNVDQKVYDAAQAAIYEKSVIVDMVRIYCKKTEIEHLRDLKNKYTSEFDKKLH